MNAHEEKPYLDTGYSLKKSEEARRKVILFPIYFGLDEETIEKMADIIFKI